MWAGSQSNWVTLEAPREEEEEASEVEGGASFALLPEEQCPTRESEVGCCVN